MTKLIFKNLDLKLQNFKTEYGFSMVELLVAATIIGVIAAAGLVSYTSANRSARNAKRQSDLEQVRAALELYRSENPTYPSGNNWSSMITALTNGDFLSNSQNIEDPRDAPYNQYRYRTSGTSCSGYDVCADLEPGAGYDYCLCNP